MGREAGYRLPTQIPSNWGAQKEPIRVTFNLVNGLNLTRRGPSQPDLEASSQETRTHATTTTSTIAFAMPPVSAQVGYLMVFDLK